MKVKDMMEAVSIKTLMKNSERGFIMMNHICEGIAKW